MWVGSQSYEGGDREELGGKILSGLVTCLSDGYLFTVDIGEGEVVDTDAKIGRS